jgi:hypothetical protein
MKQYLILFRNIDFTKDGNRWTSSPTNVYVNNSYVNYSYKRSRYGTKLSSESVYTGMDIASPSFEGDDVIDTLLDNAVYKTDIGEVVYDTSTPNLLRFVDTSSRVDLISYRIFFSNVSGNQVPFASFTFEESESAEGPWLTSVVGNNAASVYERDIKPYFRVLLDFDSTETIPSNVGILLYIEFIIHEPSVPAISQSSQEVLSRFPSWTDLYTDSLEQATPNFYIPTSTGGKFVNALLQEHLDNYEEKLISYQLNSFVGSIDLGILDWIYKSGNVSANIVNVYGDGVQLVPVNSLYDFYSGLKTDYTYYYDPVNREIITVRLYENFSVNGQAYSQEPILFYNELDELGARVGLQRLFLEENSRYQKRILDVYKNPPAVNKLGFKNTLRRELDIWKAYGVEPDSNHIGATPEVLEISDLESSTPYFDSSGKPLKDFKDFVKKINEKYPSNLGYVKWNEGMWDYGGLLQEGVSRIPAIYDNDVDLNNKFQPGIGDFDDIQFEAELKSLDKVPFDAKIVAKGLVQNETDLVYPPIYLEYEYYINYNRDVPSREETRLGLVYEIDIINELSTPGIDTYYVNLNSDNREDFTVFNSFSENSDASPEFSYINIFDEDGFAFSEIQFRNKINNELYSEENNLTLLNVYDAQEVRVVLNTNGWDVLTQEYLLFPYSSNARISFSSSEPNFYIEPDYADTISIESPDIESFNSNLLIGSNIYNTANESFRTESFNGTLILNSQTDLSDSTSVVGVLDVEKLFGNILYPADGEPTSLVINPNFGFPLNEDEIDIATILQPAYFFDPEDNSKIFMPVSYPAIPDIYYKYLDYSGEEMSENAYFEPLTIDFDSSIKNVVFSKNEEEDTSYPLVRKLWNPFTLEHVENIKGSIDRFNTIRLDGENEVFSVENNFVSKYSLSRENFNIEDSFDYDFEFLEIVNSDDKINFYSNFYLDNLSSREIFNNILSTNPVNSNGVFEYSVFANRNEDIIRFISPSIKNGWLFLDQKKYYNYSRPKIETFYGKFFEIELSETPRRGSPVYIEVQGKEFRQIPRDKETDFGRIYEKTIGNKSNYLYAAYSDIENAIVYDEFTGKFISIGISSADNVLEPFNSATPAIEGREYSISYNVKDSYYLQKDFYKEEENSYISKIDFFATPNTDQLYQVVYETDLFNSSKEIDLSIDAKNNPLDKGYVYVSKKNYKFSYVKAFVSPNVIKSGQDSVMNLVIISFDENNNPKPYQAFVVDGENIICDPQYVLTNSNGIAFATVTYSSESEVSTGFIGNINIEGIGLFEYFRLVESGEVRITEDGEIRLASYDIPDEFYEFTNSDAGNYSKVVEYYVAPYGQNDYEIKCVPDKLITLADGVSEQYIYGKVTYMGKKITSPVTVYYRFADSIKDLFQTTDLDIDFSVETNEIGEFTIGPIGVNTKYNPGYRFCAVDTMATLDVETPSTKSTIAGDIVYWYEQYDSAHYDTEQLPPPLVYNKTINIDEFMLATPSFILDVTDPDNIINTDSTPNWLPPKWYPLDMKYQYQLGLFGSTPNYIENYNNLHPDYQEE